MLQVHNLWKIYSTERGEIPAFQDISLEVPSGQFVSIVGRSGSGKSSLLSAIAGLSRPSRGSVTIKGFDIWSLSARARTEFRNQHIGLVFQFASLLPTLRAVDNVALPALLRPEVDLNLVYAKAETLLKQVGLAASGDAYPSELSGGEQRRVAIARALINSPSLFLADEPTSDLDVATEAEIVTLLRSLVQTEGKTLILVTHTLSLAAQADRVFLLEQGKLTQQTGHFPEFVPASTLLSIPLEKPLFEPSSSNTNTVETSAVSLRLGTGVFRFRPRLVLLALPLFLLLGAIDTGVSWYQHQQLALKKQRRLKLEQSAYSYLYVDVKNVEYTGDNQSYQVTFLLQNLNPQQPMFVLVMPLQVFVQVGMLWQEVPSRSQKSEDAQMIQLAAQAQEFKAVFTPNVEHWTELIPGYLHVRFSVEMLISLRSQPQNDLVERSDRYFVYLKPYQADDEAILRQNQFPGKPPVYIPMPAH